MGKIFGISDLPVSTIMSVFEPPKVPKPKVQNIFIPRTKADVFVSEKLEEAEKLGKTIKPFLRKTCNKCNKFVGRVQ